MDKELIAKVFIEETENLKENSQYGIYLSNDEFKKFFVEPFTDVLKVAKIALKDVGTGVLYNLRILFTFSTSKKQALLKRYEKKREEFKKEYEPIMKRVDEGLSDAKYLMFMANPAGYIAAKAVGQGVEVGKFINDTFKEQRKSMDPDDPDTDRAPAGPIVGALRDLKNIFFGESKKISNLDMLLEVEGENLDIDEEAKKGLEESGISVSDIDKKFEEWIQMKESSIKDVEDEGIPNRIKALVEMMNSKNVEELEKAIQEAKKYELDLGNYMNDFNTELEKGMSEISEAFKQEENKSKKSEEKVTEAKEDKKDSKLISSLKKLPKIKKLGDKATKEDYEEAIKESLFNTLKSNLQDDGDRIISEIQEDMREVADIIVAPFEDDASIKDFADSSPKAKDIAEKILKFKKEITGG